MGRFQCCSGLYIQRSDSLKGSGVVHEAHAREEQMKQRKKFTEQQKYTEQAKKSREYMFTGALK